MWWLVTDVALFRVIIWFNSFFVSAATLRVAGSLQKSTEVMQMMQSLIKVPEVASTMREMSKEMMKVWHSLRKNYNIMFSILI